ncbi:uncharacterized protein [Henckelia pumila]|uniref:uncharacterized protein n=1 Tax=Henckelia pumila TaxID=405737 RepID=UPI003C6E9528
MPHTPLPTLNLIIFVVYINRCTIKFHLHSDPNCKPFWIQAPSINLHTQIPTITCKVYCCMGNTNGFKKWKTQLVVYAVTIFFFFGFCAYGRTSMICSYSFSECKRPMLLALKANEDYLQQNSDRNKILRLVDTTITSIAGARRLLGHGPGSSPPLCTSKCGRCMPCKPVHVTVPPGTPVTTEYYPEAWRCKCGNKFVHVLAPPEETKWAQRTIVGGGFVPNPDDDSGVVTVIWVIFFS